MLWRYPCFGSLLILLSLQFLVFGRSKQGDHPIGESDHEENRLRILAVIGFLSKAGLQEHFPMGIVTGHITRKGEAIYKP